MTNKERYQRAFSSLHTSPHFTVQLEDGSMRTTFLKTRAALAAAGTALALALGGTGAYAANIGGIQRTVQVWLHGELTNAVMTVDEEAGSYTITDGSGNRLRSGGGVAMEEDGSERPLTADEFYEYLSNEVCTDTEGGRLYLLYRDQRLDLTDQFKDSDYCYVALKDGNETIYATVTRQGGVATSRARYLMPNEFSTG